jgi:hypothetical protein
MPITHQQISENNGIKVFTHHDIKLETFITKWVIPEKIKFPKWQREDCWTDEYRIKLIESIMIKNDIPKFYLSQIENDNSYLLDGGHRTRSMKGYIENMFPIKIDNEYVYYNKIPENKEKLKEYRIFEEKELNIFNNYPLSICIYKNLTEKDSRIIFNDLQNSKPMTMADIVNSYESPLVDYLREFHKYKINETQTLEDFSINVPDHVFPTNENSKLLYHLASIWTIIIPNSIENKEIEALSYAVQGETKEKSAVYYYIHKYDEELNKIDTDKFEEIIIWYINTLNKLVEYDDMVLTEKKSSLKRGECLSLIHSYLYVKNFSVKKYFDMINEIREYEYMKKLSNKLVDDNQDQYRINKQNLEDLNKKYNNKLSGWSGNHTNKDHMSRRYNIIKDKCILDSIINDCQDINIIE